MKKIMLMLSMLLVSGLSFAGGNDWLLGNWKMAHDPDGDTRDIISFSKGGQFVTTEVSSGKQIKGMYFVKSSHVDVSLVYQGKTFKKLKLSYDDAKDKLYYNPKHAKDPAYYTKIE